MCSRLFVLISLVAIMQLKLSLAIPFHGNTLRRVKLDSENNWKAEQPSGTDYQPAEEDEIQDVHQMTKRGKSYSNAEENANQLFQSAMQLHNLNAAAENTNSGVTTRSDEEADAQNSNEIENTGEIEQPVSLIPGATQANNYGEEKFKKELTGDNNSNGSDANSDKENSESVLTLQSDQTNNVDDTKMNPTEDNHQKKRCGSHSCSFKEPPTPPPCDEKPACEDKPRLPCDFEEEDRYKQNSTKIAQQAANAAKLASESQKMAAEHAARIVKTQLSEQAQQASQKAQAILAGKELIVAELECQLHDAEALYREMCISVEHVRKNLEAATAARKDACDEVEALQLSMKIAKKNVMDGETVVEGTQAVVEEREGLLRSAKRRLQTLLQQLKIARCDFRNTQVLAQKACQAAAEARANANRCRRKLKRNDQR